MLIYTNKFIKDWAAGAQIWCFALVRPSHKGNLAIEAHEKEHVKQWLNTTIIAATVIAFFLFVGVRHSNLRVEEALPLFWLAPSLHGLLYWAFRPYRLWAEVRAYKKSLEFRPDKLSYYTLMLTSKYRLKISLTEAENHLKQ